MVTLEKFLLDINKSFSRWSTHFQTKEVKYYNFLYVYPFSYDRPELTGFTTAVRDYLNELDWGWDIPYVSVVVTNYVYGDLKNEVVNVKHFNKKIDDKSLNLLYQDVEELVTFIKFCRNFN